MTHATLAQTSATKSRHWQTKIPAAKQTYYNLSIVAWPLKMNERSRIDTLWRLEHPFDGIELAELVGKT
jgi:hypothetical protein